MRDIKYKTVSCGPTGSFQPGDLRHGVSDDEARALVNGGYAEYIGQPEPVREQAVVAPVEHAVGVGNPVKPTQPETRAPRRSR